MSRRCNYEYRQDGIHQLTLLESSDAAVNQFMGYIDRICMTEDQTPMLLIDFTQAGLPPVNYFISRMNEWQQARSDACIGRRAVLYSGTGMTRSLLEHIANLMTFFQKDQTRFFQRQHQAAALDWLQNKPAPARTY